MVQDYTLNEVTSTQLKPMRLTDEEIKAKHPYQYMYPASRKHHDYTQLVKKNQFLLFNFPLGITEAKVREICSVKGVQILRTALTPSLKEEKIAFAFVEVANPS